MKHLLTSLLVFLVFTAGWTQVQPTVAPKPAETKLGKFLSQSSSLFVVKKVNLPNIKGPDTFFFEINSASLTDNTELKVRGVKLTGYQYNSIGGDTSSVFIDEEEIPSLVSAIRKLVTDAKPAKIIDMGELGPQKVMTTIRVISLDGAEFAFDETLVGNFRVTIGYRSFDAGNASAFTKIADSLEKAGAILKKL